MLKAAKETGHVNKVRDRLPPKDVWLHDPEHDGLLETPLDERGLVDLNKLVALVKDTVDPDYEWVSNENDVHHLQWMSRHYDVADAFVEADARAFRELVSRKAYMPRILHNRIHHITAPPPVPSEEVMNYSIDAQRVAMSLARTAQLATKLTRMTRNNQIPAHRLRERLDQEFINYNLYVENAREVPEEFSLLKLDELEVESIDEMLLANKRLGKLALDRIPIVRRQIRLAA